MATLHMEVEAARQTRSTITNTHSQLTSDVSTITNSIQGLVGASWQGASANEFQSEYERWRQSVNQMLDTLQQLGARLDNEITEWENMASRLSG